MNSQSNDPSNDCNKTNDNNTDGSAITNQRSELSQIDKNLKHNDTTITSDDVSLQMEDNSPTKDAASCNTDNPDAGISKQEVETKEIDNSSYATAFTITFDGEDVGPKKFGIRDSIRKFAPPKVFTKPLKKVTSADDDNVLDCMVDSGSASLPFNNRTSLTSSSSNFNRNNKARSSHNTKYSNVNDSVSYLMDKMLDLKQMSENKTMYQTTRINRDLSYTDPESLGDVEVKSDNGTYIVGEEDQELQADREKIDELFGVVKKAEQSVLADFAGQIDARQSRDTSNKKALSRERQDHINRLAQLPARSSSSTRQDQTAAKNTIHKPRDRNRRSRNSSCERSNMSKDHNKQRSISQSSRNLHHSYIDSDSAGSRSSLVQQANESSSQSLILEQQLNSNPSTTRYNRTFALRRARLGLGEPSRTGDSQQDQLKCPVQLSPRRALHQQMSPSHQNVANNTSNNFSRADGGRFSLRSKNFGTPTRVLKAAQRSCQQTNLSNSNTQPLRFPQAQVNPGSDIDYNSVQQNDLIDDTAYINARLSGQSNVVNNSRHLGASFYKRSPSDLHQSTLQDSSYYNYYQYPQQQLIRTSREPTNLGQERYMVQNRAEATLSRLGALDNLVISAISNLSSKLRESICHLLVHHAKRLPVDDETRSIVEEILPQLSADLTSSARSPTSIDEIDHSSHYELSKTLRNLKKMEQMVGVIGQITSQLSANTENKSSSPSVAAKLSNRSPTSSIKSSNNSNRSDANVSINSEYNNLEQNL